MDWNWFFAAYAQSAAALIAIIGAFIISKLIDESEKEEQHENKIDELKMRYNDLNRRILINYEKFEWDDEQIIKYSKRLMESIKKREFNNLSEKDMLKKLFDLEPELFGTDNCLENFKKRIKDLEYTKGIIKFNSSVSLDHWDQFINNKIFIDQLKIESIGLIEQFNKIKTDLLRIQKNLKPIKIIIWILIIGFFLTVIYPLSFMPIESNSIPTVGFSFSLVKEHFLSIRGVLLILLTLVIEGIFGYFLWMIYKIENKYKNVLNKLEDKYFDISSYCKYFK